MTMKALVMDGNQRPALAITRSLGRRGISVLVGEEEPDALASASRHCAGQVTYPSPYREPEAFSGFLLDFVRREGVDVVMPVTDVTTSAVCLNADALRRHAAVAMPTFSAFDRMTDKSNALRAAARCGIPIPRTHFVDGIEALRKVAGQIEYPAVIKSARSRILTPRGWSATGVHYAGSEAELRGLYERAEYLAAYPSLIQQRVFGPGTGLFVLFEHGRLLTAFAHRRIREKPPSGGVSVLCESVPVMPELRADAVRLLGPLGWHGVAMLEYKRDRYTGDRYLIEVNGRFWGSLQLAVDSGVDFPYLSWQLALGQRPDVPETYRVGTTSRWLLGDLDQLLSRLLGRRRDLALPDDAPSRLGALVAFVTSTRPGVGDQTASVGDPGPFLHEVRRYVRSLWVSLAARARRRAARFRGLPLRRKPVTAEP